MTEIIVRPMIAGDLADATRIYRLAFGTFLGAPDPAQFRLDIRALETRFATDPGTAFAVAEGEGARAGVEEVGGLAGDLGASPAGDHG